MSTEEQRAKWREAARKHYSNPANRKKKRADEQQRYWQNVEAQRARSLKYYAANREKLRARSLKHYHDNREAITARRRKLRAAKRERS